ncbi:MAG TPA: FkbM family methyltransferase [Xanthobacteraceae bacterium]|jgi:FkbM family methyltransferase|nr:FkbM family methyltransferase [Xanthobacteraceae bacterium]
MRDNLIYDVGMLNGDDSAYYLSLGYNVIGIEANPVMAEKCRVRLEREIASGKMTLLNVGISDAEGVLPFWAFTTHPQYSTFHEPDAFLAEFPRQTIPVPCRTFCSVLEQFGTPHYAKIDIESNDIFCLQDLRPSDLPRFVSFEKEESGDFHRALSVLHELGYNGSKLIGQHSLLPVEYPASKEQLDPERAVGRLHGKNPALRIARKLGLRKRFQRQADLARTNGRWTFPYGSSGPFGDALPGRWQSFEEITRTFEVAEEQRSAGARSIFWSDRDFWADCHATIIRSTDHGACQT